jgi:protein SCO1/2
MPATTQHLINAVNEADRVFGPDSFNVLTIGFDARNDTPGRLAQFASAQGIKFKNWRLASGDPATIEALLRDLGFSYIAIAGGFDHVTQTTIVDRDGKVYRPVYGDDFPLPVFIEPMKDVIYGVEVVLDGRHTRSRQVHLHRLRSRRRTLSHRLWVGIRQRHCCFIPSYIWRAFYREWSRTGHA